MPETRKSIRFGHSADPRSVAPHNEDLPNFTAKTSSDRTTSFAPRKSEQTPGFRPEGNRDFLAVNSCAKVAEKRSVRLTYVRGI